MSEETVENVETVETETTPSMDDALGAALDALDAPETTAEAGTETTETTETTERARGADGKFVAKSETTEKTEKTAEDAKPNGKAVEGEQVQASEETTETTETADPQLVDGKDITKAPVSWKAEAAIEFSKLPEAVRKEVHKREEDIHRGIEQYKGAATFGVEVARQFQPYQPMMQALKHAPTDIINSALQFEYAMHTGSKEQKIEVFRNLAKSYGLIEEQPELGPDGKPIQPDPKFTALESKIQTLEGKLTAKERADQQAEERRVEAARSEISKEITDFANDPKNEFYGLVKDDMLKTIQSGQAADLRDAYDKAVWVNPVTRGKLIARQQEADRKSAAEKAAEARKANLVNVTPRATPAGKAASKGTLEESLGAALDEQLAKSA
jgi:hypothetical protein